MRLPGTVTLAVFFLSSVAPVAHGQEVILTGPLAAAPHGHQYWRKHRLELGAVPGVSLGSNDGPALVWGAEGLYYPTDRFGLGLWVTGASPVWENDRTTLQGVATPELVTIPSAGKLSLFGDYIPYDLHFKAGLARVFAEPSGAMDDSWAVWLGVGVTGWSASFFSNAVDYRLVAGETLRHFVTVSFAWWPLERRWDYD